MRIENLHVQTVGEVVSQNAGVPLTTFRADDTIRRTKALYKGPKFMKEDQFKPYDSYIFNFRLYLECSDEFARPWCNQLRIVIDPVYVVSTHLVSDFGHLIENGARLLKMIVNSDFHKIEVETRRIQKLFLSYIVSVVENLSEKFTQKEDRQYSALTFIQLSRTI